jgi:16S rRNA (cytosine967-C5)-methyltransferase
MAKTRLKPQKPVKPPGARALALDILTASRRRGRSVEDLLAQALRRYPGLSRRERAFLLELVQGVKRWELKLDWLLSQVSHLPLRKLHPLVLGILRLAAFQVLMLDRVPARAAVSEAGNLARGRGLPPAHVAFTNGVLRRLAAGELPLLPDPALDPVAGLSVATAHPPWLVKRWLGRYGREEAQARLHANNRIPPLTIRVNTLKTDVETLSRRLAREGVEARPCRYSQVGLELVAVIGAPLDLPSYREGLWLFQDEAAQLVTCLLPLRPGRRVLEVGAGRGGKTTHLAEILTNQGLILAVDYHRRRLLELKAGLKRWGMTIAHPLRCDAAIHMPLKEGAVDAVLVDAPCSALGILRRHPEVKTRLTEADLATFPPRQAAMLDAAARALSPGGHLLYVTCTTEPEENDKVVHSFLARHREFRLATDPARLPPPARDLVTPPGYFRSSPKDHNLDAFFAAVLAKEG